MSMPNTHYNYGTAIRAAFEYLLEKYPEVFVIGQGLWSPWYAGGSLEGLERDFGRDRVLDSPVSENAVTGMAIGAALAGMRPIVFHPRMDFMLLAVDPIINQAANWSYLFGGEVSVPVVIRAVINRGGEQGAQHSQALHLDPCELMLMREWRISAPLVGIDCADQEPVPMKQPAQIISAHIIVCWPNGRVCRSGDKR